MSNKIVHIIGNGKSASMFDQKQPGIRITCNLPPFAIENVFTTCMVDFKMMKAIQHGGVVVPGNWVLGARPKIHMEQNPSFYMKHAAQIRGFHLALPKYCPNYTDWNCGHMATHYGATKFEPEIMHLYGFNSIFDFDMTSSTDMFLESDRGANNNNRLANNWRNVWPNLFKEFPNTEFVLYHKHNNIKINLPDNVRIIARGKK